MFLRSWGAVKAAVCRSRATGGLGPVQTRVRGGRGGGAGLWSSTVRSSSGRPRAAIVTRGTDENVLARSTGSAAEQDAISGHLGHRIGTGFLGQQSMSSDMPAIVSCDTDANAIGPARRPVVRQNEIRIRIRSDRSTRIRSHARWGCAIRGLNLDSATDGIRKRGSRVSRRRRPRPRRSSRRVTHDDGDGEGRGNGRGHV